MNQYDIIQIEDSEIARMAVKGVSESRGLSYNGVTNLEALRNLLEVDSAKVYFVDGSFPETDGGKVEKNAGKAIDLIRGKYPDSRIILLSGEMNIERMAEDLGVEYFKKGPDPFQDLLDRVSDSL